MQQLPKMTQEVIVSALRKEAITNPVFNAVAHVFALRERARQQVTMAALRLRMGQEGFNHTKEDYSKVLKFLASLGFGTLEHDRSNNITALKNIRMTLQSIGLAAVGTKNEKLEAFNPQFDYQKLTLPKATVLPQQPTAKTPPPQVQDVKPAHKDTNIKPISDFLASVVVEINGKPVVFPLPKGFTPKDLGDLLATCYSIRKTSNA